MRCDDDDDKQPGAYKTFALVFRPASSAALFKPEPCYGTDVVADRGCCFYFYLRLHQTITKNLRNRASFKVNMKTMSYVINDRMLVVSIVFFSNAYALVFYACAAN